jgi:hypothetical protein
MSREIKIDYLTLESFISEYKISHLLTNADFKVFISQQHKKYYAYLSFIAELQNYAGKRKYSQNISRKQFDFIKESCSDIGIAYFSTFHGGYKAAKLLLRSSIETFLKGFCLDDIKDIDKETSIFNLFKKAKALKYFSSDPEKILFSEIHQQYKTLCLDVHTATHLNMANVSALNYFPAYENSDAQKVSKTIMKLVPNYISLLSLKFNEQYHSFHYKNKQIIIGSIPIKLRPLVNNIE